MYTFAAGVQRSHIEDVNALHLAENLQTFETGRLFKIGGHGAWLATGGHEIVHAGNVCVRKEPVSRHILRPALSMV